MPNLSCRVTARNADGENTMVSGPASVTAPASGVDPNALFASGQAGMVFLPGTEWTDCYVEATGSPPATLCTHNTTVGTIHDKVRGTYTRISTSSQRPLYQVVNGVHSIVFDGVNDSVPLTASLYASEIDGFFSIDANGDNTGIFLSDPNSLANYIGVYQSGSGSTNLAARYDADVPITARVDGVSGYSTRGALHSAISSGRHVVGLQYAGADMNLIPWATGLYANGTQFTDYNHSLRCYGWIARFNDAMDAAEVADVETLLAG